MSFRGTLLRSGIDSDGIDVTFYRSDGVVTFRGNAVFEGDLEITGTVTTGISIGACSGAGLALVGIAGTGLDTGVILVAADQAGTPLAFGSNTVNVAVERVDVTCQQTAGSTFLGKYMTIATSGAFAATSFIQGNLTSITVAHAAQEVYAVRGTISVTASQTGDTSNQYIGLYGAVTVSGSLTLALAATGGIYGVFGSVAIGAGSTCDQPMQAGYFETTGIKANIAGETSVMKLWAGGGSDTYTDYGLNVELESNNIVAAIHLATKTSCVCPVGIEFDTTSGSFTAAFKFDDNGTLASDSAASPLGDIVAQASAGFIRVLVGSATKYIALYDAN